MLAVLIYELIVGRRSQSPDEDSLSSDPRSQPSPFAKRHFASQSPDEDSLSSDPRSQPSPFAKRHFASQSPDEDSLSSDAEQNAEPHVQAVISRSQSPDEDSLSSDICKNEVGVYRGFVYASLNPLTRIHCLPTCPDRILRDVEARSRLNPLTRIHCLPTEYGDILFDYQAGSQSPDEDSLSSD